MKLADKVAVVTGAGSGIGADAARTFAREGARVALVDVNRDALAAVEREIVDAGGEAISLCADVSDARLAAEGIATVLDKWQRIDVLLACSAISPGGTVDQLDEATWDRVFAINVKGVFLWSRAVLPTMLEQRSGSIVLVASQLVARRRQCVVCRIQRRGRDARENHGRGLRAARHPRQCADARRDRHADVARVDRALRRAGRHARTLAEPSRDAALRQRRRDVESSLVPRQR
jgi:hypothetical protein